MNKLETLLKGALGYKVPAEFAAENYDYEAALRDEMRSLFFDEKGHFSNRLYRKNKDDVFDLMSVMLTEILPQSVSEVLNPFCDIMNFPNGSRPEFRIIKGRQRGKTFVTRCTEAGDYEAFRLDHGSVSLYPKAIGGAGYIDFERYLEGADDISVIFSIIQEGMQDRIFEMVQDLLLQSWNLAGRPAKNKVATNGFDAASMVDLINAVRPYGTPVIYCTPEFASTMSNEITYATSSHTIPDEDKTDIRERGYIGVFRGAKVIVLPQSYTDDTNEKLTMNPSFAYVIPTGKEKIVKLAFEGEAIFKEVERDGDWSTLLKGYHKVGGAIVSTPNYWGIYYNASIDAGGWSAYNIALNISVG